MHQSEVVQTLKPKQSSSPPRYVKRTIFNMPQSQMTPYLVAKKNCIEIKKKQNPNTFENIIGGNNMMKNGQDMYYMKN